MLIEVIVGIVLGTASGIFPGIHVNLISVLILSLVSKISLQNESLFLIIICMGLTHTFLDFIPSTFLGVPAPDTAMSMLPAHEMVNRGEGVKAILLTLKGSLYSFFLCLLFVPFLIYFFPNISKFLKGRTGIVLLGIIIFIFYLEHIHGDLKNALIVFALAGILGNIVLNSKIEEPLFPLLTGLFGVSIILDSIRNKTTIPPQRKLRKKLIEMVGKPNKTTIVSFLSGGLTGFLPGIGSAQASIIGSVIAKEDDGEKYLEMQGGINTVNFFVSLITLYTISKPRNGALVVAQKLVKKLTFSFLVESLIALTITAIIATILGIYIASKIGVWIPRINYSLLMKCILIFILVVTYLLSKFEGLIVLILATLIGFICIKLKVPKHFCMACILVPVMIWTL